MAGLFDKLQAELEARQPVKGITPADLLDFSPELRRLINTITRRGAMSLAEITLELDVQSSELKGLLDKLVEKGFLKDLHVNGEQRYKTCYTREPKRSRVPSSIWDALDG